MQAASSSPSGREGRLAPGVPLSAREQLHAPRKNADESVLKIIDVSKSFGAHAALSHVDLALARSETVAVVGPSGSGKTTLLRCVNFLTPYDSGRIYVNGRLVGYREDRDTFVRDSEHNVNQIRKRIGIVFQRFNLFRHRTVLGNLLEGPLYVLKISKEEAVARAREVLRTVGLADKWNAYPDQLSGGQQQRVAIARALCMKPELMLFDEVTSALDPELVGEVLAVMRQLAQEGMTMLVVTHEMSFARDAADRVVFMEDGRITADRPAQEFFAHPSSPRIEAFLKRLSSK
jgi:polar amino acid transport system ATP-binding protein